MYLKLNQNQSLDNNNNEAFFYATKCRSKLSSARLSNNRGFPRGYVSNIPFNLNSENEPSGRFLRIELQECAVRECAEGAEKQKLQLQGSAWWQCRHAKYLKRGIWGARSEDCSLLGSQECTIPHRLCIISTTTCTTITCAASCTWDFACLHFHHALSCALPPL